MQAPEEVFISPEDNFIQEAPGGAEGGHQPLGTALSPLQH